MVGLRHDGDLLGVVVLKLKFCLVGILEVGVWELGCVR